MHWFSTKSLIIFILNMISFDNKNPIERKNIISSKWFEMIFESILFYFA